MASKTVYVRSGAAAPQPSPLRETAPQQELRLPAGTLLRVRMNNSIDTRHNRPGDTFSAKVTSAVTENGVTVIPVGANAHGHLVESKASGRFKGRAVVAMRLDSIEFRGRRYNVQTASVTRQTTGHKKRNLTLIGGGTGFGASIGAIAAGAPGALIGAGAGAAAGTIGEAFTGKKQLRIPVETPVSFRLSQPVRLS